MLISAYRPFDYAVSETVKKYKLKFYEEGVVVEEDLPAENQQPADEDLKKETDDKVKQLEGTLLIFVQLDLLLIWIFDLNLSFFFDSGILALTVLE